MKPHFLWTEKYRPTKVADTVLPERLRVVFQEFVDKKNVPNLLLVGRPGIGKTAVARAMLDELGADVMIINGSLERGIDVIRDKVSQFASSMSFTGGRKYVIFDEADAISWTPRRPIVVSF
jgi:replication factor C small subunit